MIAYSSTTACRAARAPTACPPARISTTRTSRSSALVCRAGLLDDIGKAFATIFSPPKDTIDFRKNEPMGFKGAPGHNAHHEGARRPFSDGVVRQDAAAAAATMAAEGGADGGAMGYVGDALQRVMGHNFESAGDAGDNVSTGAQGWKGDLHKRNKDGFHLPKQP